MKIPFGGGSGIRALGIALLVSSVTLEAAFASSISGVSTAVLQTTGPRAGKWLYTIQAQWTSDIPTWQITLDLEQASCPCVCAGVFDTDFPAGPGAGNGGTCTALFNGTFSCDGDPFVNLSTPSIDWWPMSSGCRPHGVGAGTLTFFSDLRPKNNPSSATLYARSGNTVWTGQVTGHLPSCVGCASTEVDTHTWGRIKSVYR